jgi:hypothetical protein
LALHKSHREILALPAPEFRRWQLLNMLQPWLFQGTAFLMTTLYNVNLVSKDKAKSVTDLIEDNLEEVLKSLKPLPDLENMTEDDKENIRRMAKAHFGIK